MTNKTLAGIAVLALAQGLAGCGGSGPSAGVPNPVIPTPNGIIFMRGTVSDTAFRPLAGTRVEVLDGPQAGLSTTAGVTGDFSFSGIFDEGTRFRATKEGHVTSTRTLQPFCMPCNPNWWVNFSLEVLSPPLNLAGDYTLTFVADSACTTLPNDVRTRTYEATIPATSNAYFGVRAGGATFYKDWNILDMGVAGDYVGFWLETLVEQIAPNTFLSFGGLAAASIGTTATPTIVLPFSGEIGYCVTKSDTGRFEDCYQGQTAARQQCTSNNHRLILMRR